MATASSITNVYFRFQGLEYFRANASSVQLGSYGEKKIAAGGAPYLAVEDDVSRTNLEGRVKHLGNVQIDWTRENKGDVEANGQLHCFGVSAQVARQRSFEEVKSAKLELCEFAIQEGDLKRMLNEDANRARNFLKQTGPDGRVLTTVFCVVEAELAKCFKAATEIRAVVVAGASTLQIVARSSSGSQSIELDKHSCFAYSLHRVTQWNKDQSAVTEMVADYAGGQG
jgi:hypothetical protein